MTAEFRKQRELELQETVAKLLGWERLPPPAMPKWQRPTKDGVEGLDELLPWSTNIMYAWTLVNIMIDNGFIVQLNTPDSFGGTNWVRATEMRVKDGYVAHGTGPTMSIAICGTFIDWMKYCRK